MSKALERLYAEGKVLSIGVSNWNPVLLQELMSVSHVNPHAVEQMHNIVDQEWGMYPLDMLLCCTGNWVNQWCLRYRWGN